MNKLTVTQTTDEMLAVASRRKFLQQLAYGSLLAVSGSGIASAAKHATAKSSSHASKAPAHTAKPSASHHATANNHAVKHQAGKHEASHHVAKHENAHHLAKHEVEKHHGKHHDVITTAQHHGHSHPQAVHHAHHEVIELAQVSPYRPTPMTHIAAYTPHKTLTLKNAQTGGALRVTYFENGRYIEDALKEIDYLYQDHLTGDVYPIDPALLDQLHEVKQMVGTTNPIHIVCGYRSPMTNAYLRRQSGAVARNSLHMQGRAVDIRIEGVDVRNIRNAALAMGRGGVGYYPSAGFVHLDTGDIRTWQS